MTLLTHLHIYNVEDKLASRMLRLSLHSPDKYSHRLNALSSGLFIGEFVIRRRC